ncbi:MAG: tripartite tricarboxylate transporter substrate binding protein [Proteobacteria bacterium]|nr:tripartite tricarboxylate transporter substrate binding protein [Pseudomonadota bacterium]MBS0495118.1 tripartite tricarboxylate transporter substrate binding protein [Pseudomonadota bacterium]
MLKTYSRRQWLAQAAATGALATLGLPGTSLAKENWPAKPIRIVVPYAPGGPADAVARVLAEGLSGRLGQAVIVDNRPGASGIVGTDAAVRAAPDGYTFLISITSSMLINKFLYAKLPYDPEKDLALVSEIALGPLVLVVHPSVPATTAPELLAYIKQQKGKLSYGSWGAGSTPHLAGFHMSKSQGADMVHVSYKGEAPMLQDLLAGQIQMAFMTAMAAKAHAETGRVRLVGVTGEKRIDVLPSVPTFAEQGLKDEAYRLVGFVGMAAPANTPKEIIQRMSREVVALSSQASVKDKIAAVGLFPSPSGTPEAFAASYKRDAPSWAALIKTAGVQLD